ncbi:hypothetical protein [Portibacter marinus]|uniref:hypothetical protein n=1 Tax=Portibacter marinus TaxID=2898660 RepID=UPI001F356AA4|nr:hypothetical protein [Portibacter marinus]
MNCTHIQFAKHLEMDRKDILMLLFSITFLTFVIFKFVHALHVDENKITEGVVERQSITFILGNDENSENQFYSNARNYFLLNPEKRTDVVITNRRSLNEVISVINENYLQTHKPFGQIHLVVHGNPWAGLSLPLNQGDARLTNEVLKQSLKNGQVAKVTEQAVDSLTRMEIFSCGLGHNKSLNATFKTIFNQCAIRSTEGYVNFQQIGTQFHMNELQVYYAFYPTAYKPADLHIARQLEEKYPNVSVNWIEAMNQSYQYNIPVEWEMVYPEYDVPALNNKMDEMEWLMNQDELLDLIDKIGIPFDYFRWIIKPKQDAVKVFGKVTVFCVMEEIKV